MSFIKVQKISRDTDGKILTGSAAIVESVYVKDGKFHSKQVTKEKLGKVLWLSEDKKKGVFSSPTRGLVEYDAESDEFVPVDRDDPRIDQGVLFPEPVIHTVFGDAYLLLNNMYEQGMTSLLREVFLPDEEYERVMAHTLYSVLRDGSHISCDNFVMKSFASYLFNDVSVSSLYSDTVFFTLMGDDRVKTAFFRNFVSSMRKKNKDFGKACFVDTTPLPNDTKDNPFNKLCSHGLSATAVQMRLAMVLDEDTGFPVWYDVIPGNLLDLKNLGPLLKNVETTLGVNIDSLVLDAGYVSSELITAINLDTYDQEIGEGRRFIARMPDKKGYPYAELYRNNCKLFQNGKYTFLRNDHRYFGVRRQITVFGKEEHAYVYVDFDNALWKFKNYVLEHPSEYEQLTDKMKTKKTYEFGFFVLLSNIKKTPSEILEDYFCRMLIEAFFKTGKEYLHLLPISKWTDTTVRGKILADIVATIVYKNFEKSAKDKMPSFTRVIGATQSLMCTLSGDNVIIESPNKQTVQAYSYFGQTVPSSVALSDFKEKIILL